MLDSGMKIHLFLLSFFLIFISSFVFARSDLNCTTTQKIYDPLPNDQQIYQNYPSVEGQYLMFNQRKDIPTNPYSTYLFDMGSDKRPFTIDDGNIWNAYIGSSAPGVARGLFVHDDKLFVMEWNYGVPGSRKIKYCRISLGDCTPAGNYIEIYSTPNYLHNFDVFGNTLVWDEASHSQFGVINILMLNLQTGVVAAITDNNSSSFYVGLPTTSGSKVFWEQNANLPPNNDKDTIMSYDVTNHSIVPIYQSPDGNSLFLSKARKYSSRIQILFGDYETGKIFTISTSTDLTRISNPTLAAYSTVANFNYLTLNNNLPKVLLPTRGSFEYFQSTGIGQTVKSIDLMTNVQSIVGSEIPNTTMVNGYVGDFSISSAENVYAFIENYHPVPSGNTNYQRIVANYCI